MIVERFTYIPGTQIVALCDYEASRAEKCQDILKKASMPKAAIYSGCSNLQLQTLLYHLNRQPSGHMRHFQNNQNLLLYDLQLLFPFQNRKKKYCLFQDVYKRQLHAICLHQENTSSYFLSINRAAQIINWK